MTRTPRPSPVLTAICLIAVSVTTLGEPSPEKIRRTNDRLAQPSRTARWEQVELTFTAAWDYASPYTDVDLQVEFTGPDKHTVRRPAFWDGGRIWRVRFAAPVTGLWTWRSECSRSDDAGLHQQRGELAVSAYGGDHPLIRHGLLRMSPGKRNVIHHDGTPFFMVADTPWALPWRGTIEAVTEYARDRQSKGFNAALLMTVQPDRDARGPRNRHEVGGFDVGFEDLPDGHLNRLRPEYFQILDQLLEILHAHGIVPVLQPVFQGYGWKGQRVLGTHAVPAEYARYCRYLLARYGARPAMWLVSADGIGAYPCTIAGGEEIERWDAYQQPTGFHYNPFDDYQPANQAKDKCFHYNRSMQDAPWLDFQWCQTGHGGRHLPDKVRRMHDNLPIKAVANGEPTYEGVRDANNGAGWWQGHEAWLNLTAGGTMGVVYGAGGLWQWKLFADEPGWPAWANSPGRSWREALQQEGSRYVGHVGRALAGYDIADMTKLPDIDPQAVGKPGELYIVYLPEGGSTTLAGLGRALPYRWFNPRTGTYAGEGRVDTRSAALTAPSAEPWVLLAGQTLVGSAARSAEANADRIRPHEANPRYWQYKGKPVLLLGGSKDDNLFQIPDLREHLDEMVAVGANYIRNTMSDRPDYGFEVRAFRQQPDGKFDLQQWNEEYWQRFENLLRWTAERDIIVQIELWDMHDMLRPDYWAAIPWNPDRNINYTFENTRLPRQPSPTAYRSGESVGRPHEFFHSIPAVNNDTVLLDFQRRFVDRVLEHTLRYDHVLYCISNEIHTEYSPEWGWYWAGHLRQRAALAGKGIEVTEMYWAPKLKHRAHRDSLDRPEVYSFFEASQNSAILDPEENRQNLQFVYQYLSARPRPINHTKIYGADTGAVWTGTTQNAQEKFWRNIFGGSAASRFHRPPSGLGLSGAARVHIKSLRLLTNAMNVFVCTPHNDLLSERSPNEAYCLAEPGRQYAVYFPNGGAARLDVSAAQGPLQVRWLDVARSAWQPPQTVSGGATLELKTPGQGHWVALIIRQ